MNDPHPLIYKILTPAQWKAFQNDGQFLGAPIDLADGFIHFSAEHQVEETVAKHFAGQGDLILAEVATDSLGEALRWEVSRGGDLFPHLYAPLALTAVVRHTVLPQLETGSHRFPVQW
ncbi:DUF952 domain-containing protein [Rosistilla oblonga]|uniref:DUF952 domain-containing protein n=1 Tax=Rosistilla oblonga TaxID=2527990 RepID=UPI003A97EBE3